MNYHEYISETKVHVDYFDIDPMMGETVGFKIVKGGTYHIKIKLRIKKISGADMVFHIQRSHNTDSFDPVWSAIRGVPFTDKDDGKNIRIFEDIIEHYYEKDEILTIYPVTRDNLTAKFTIEKGSYIRFSYFW